jgi:hypothetical protein
VEDQDLIKCFYGARSCLGYINIRSPQSSQSQSTASTTTPPDRYAVQQVTYITSTTKTVRNMLSSSNIPSHGMKHSQGLLAQGFYTSNRSKVITEHAGRMSTASTYRTSVKRPSYPVVGTASRRNKEILILPTTPPRTPPNTYEQNKRKRDNNN